MQQVSRVPRLISSLGRLAVSLARAVRSLSSECSLSRETRILSRRNAYFSAPRQAVRAGLQAGGWSRVEVEVEVGVDGG